VVKKAWKRPSDRVCATASDISRLGTKRSGNGTTLEPPPCTTKKERVSEEGSEARRCGDTSVTDSSMRGSTDQPHITTGPARTPIAPELAI
jgi:hypothetical protein